ncbi:MAG: DUF4143 domain-containing protein [bacterium]
MSKAARHAAVCPLVVEKARAESLVKTGTVPVDERKSERQMNAGDKVKYSTIDHHRPARQVREAIDLLVKAGILYRVTHSDASGMPLNAMINPKFFKLYFLDVGLLNFLCGTKYIAPDAIRAMDFINKGNVAEQFVAQHLFFAGRVNCAPELFYWLAVPQGEEMARRSPANGDVIRSHEVGKVGLFAPF